ncbi:hypothetical protein CHLRE_12g518772v5 [Chlamydomonas reinhardtii]|uniref:RRM domain-containing protein n=1 Tax=Chlamydomonas reinhardtii TaxID=3055 RepID=A0A2K3D3X5_CHLRE|nr:uncharacterized protein CHLRE_12g518772v5 [Chlamydomonas reinhardtii]PNW75242.1 hypothetical protein CHLRE_12g518772v5 [Chlamydomonas reinhardtii]
MHKLARPDRPIFCGNFEYEAQERDVVRLFETFGPVDKIEMKEGFAFVYMRHVCDGEAAVAALHGWEWGVQRRRLKVEWGKRHDWEYRSRCSGSPPSHKLFVINFDPSRTGEQELWRYFSPFGRVTRVQMVRNFAFVVFADLRDAVAAQQRTNGAILEGRTLNVEFSASGEGGGGGGGGAAANTAAAVGLPPLPGSPAAAATTFSPGRAGGGYGYSLGPANAYGGGGGYDGGVADRALLIDRWYCPPPPPPLGLRLRSPMPAAGISHRRQDRLDRRPGAAGATAAAATAGDDSGRHDLEDGEYRRRSRSRSSSTSSRSSSSSSGGGNPRRRQRRRRQRGGRRVRNRRERERASRRSRSRSRSRTGGGSGDGDDEADDVGADQRDKRRSRSGGRKSSSRSCSRSRSRRSGTASAGSRSRSDERCSNSPPRRRGRGRSPTSHSTRHRSASPSRRRGSSSRRRGGSRSRRGAERGHGRRNSKSRSRREGRHRDDFLQGRDQKR